MTKPGKEAIVFVHGMCRFRHTLYWRIGRHMQQQGYDCHYFPYISYLRKTKKHVERLQEFVATRVLGSATRFHFVGHSFGALLSCRAALMLDDERLSSIVCLSPLFAPAKLAIVNRNNWLYWLTTGKAGQEILDPQTFYGLSKLADRIGCIRGTISLGRWGKRFFGGQHDGIISHNEMYVNGLRKAVDVQALHTFMVYHPKTVLMVERFIKTQSFDC